MALGVALCAAIGALAVGPVVETLRGDSSSPATAPIPEAASVASATTDQAALPDTEPAASVVERTKKPRKKAKPSPAATSTAAAGAAAEVAASLKGRTVHLDPGHNPGNADHADEANAPVSYGVGEKPCDTTGTSTPSGYSEAEYNLDVTARVARILGARGARVVITPVRQRPWGPCITERAGLGNEVAADAAVSIHANGDENSSSRGFFVILPAEPISSIGLTQEMIDADAALGAAILEAYGPATGLDKGYGDGYLRSNNYAGTNLSKVPKVFIETGHMSNADEAALLETASFRAKAARGIANGIASFLLAN